MPSLQKLSSASSSRPISPFPTASLPPPLVINDANNNPAKNIDGLEVLVEPPRTFADGGTSRPCSRPHSRHSSRRGSVASSLGGSPERQGRTDNRPRTPSQLRRSSRTGSLVDIANQVSRENDFRSPFRFVFLELLLNLIGAGKNGSISFLKDIKGPPLWKEQRLTKA